MERLLLRIIPQTLIQSRTQDVGYYAHCGPNLSSCYHRALGPEIAVLKLYHRVHPWWTGRNINPTLPLSHIYLTPVYAFEYSIAISS